MDKEKKAAKKAQKKFQKHRKKCADLVCIKCSHKYKKHGIVRSMFLFGPTSVGGGCIGEIRVTDDAGVIRVQQCKCDMKPNDVEANAGKTHKAKLSLPVNLNDLLQERQK